jgi:hypothetical protein
MGFPVRLLNQRRVGRVEVHALHQGLPCKQSQILAHRHGHGAAHRFEWLRDAGLALQNLHDVQAEATVHEAWQHADLNVAEQRARFEAGQGGAITPLMSVDKALEELDTFDALVEESRQYRQDWAIVFVASLSGRSGRAPMSKDADKPLQRMIQFIKAGSFIPFGRQFQPMPFN